MIDSFKAFDSRNLTKLKQSDLDHILVIFMKSYLKKQTSTL